MFFHFDSEKKKQLIKQVKRYSSYVGWEVASVSISHKDPSLKYILDKMIKEQIAVIIDGN